MQERQGGLDRHRDGAAEPLTPVWATMASVSPADRVVPDGTRPEGEEQQRDGSINGGRNSSWRAWLGWAMSIALVLFLWFVVGLALLPVKTGSMAPGIKPGDLIVAVKPWLSPPKVGEIVVAQPEFAPGSEKLPAIAHRIINTQPGGWLTKGDANPEPDGWVVRPQDISRVSVLVIPTAKIRSPYTVAILIGLMVLYFLWPGKVTETLISTVPVDGGNQRLKHARTGRHRKLRP